MNARRPRSRAADFALAVLLLEQAALAAASRSRPGRGLERAAAAAPGLLLLLAARAAARRRPLRSALWLFAAFPAHLVDLALREARAAEEPRRPRGS